MPDSNSSERFLGRLIADSARLQRTVFDRRMRTLGLTRSQWLVMSRLHFKPGASQSELADLMEIEKATAGRLIDRLEANGWVERRADPDDRRINRIHMTAKGAEIDAAMRPIAEGMVEEALGGLSGPEREQLIDLMIRVKRELLAMAEETAPSSVEQANVEQVNGETRTAMTESA